MGTNAEPETTPNVTDANPEASRSPVKRRPGNPNMRHGAPSVNPRGRPRSGLALADAIREKLDPHKIVELVVRYAEDEEVPLERRLAVLLPWCHAGYLRPPTTTVNVDASPLAIDYSKVPLEARLAEIERRRALRAAYEEQPSAPDAIDAESVEKG